MFDGQYFTVIAVNGSFLDAIDPNTDSLRYDGLTWAEACELARLSFNQGFEIVLWREQEGGEDEQKEDPLSEKAV